MGLPVARAETEITRAILEFLHRLPGVLAWRQNVGAFVGEHKGKKRFVQFGRPGMSDILGAVTLNCETTCELWEAILEPSIEAGRMKQADDRGFAILLAIEVKRPGESPTPAQRRFLEAVMRAGGVAFVATSVEDVRREFVSRKIGGLHRAVGAGG
jgi:hypothetical protein